MKKYLVIALFLVTMTSSIDCSKKWYKIEFTGKNVAATYFYYTEDMFMASMKETTILINLLKQARQHNNPIRAQNLKESVQHISQVQNNSLIKLLAQYKN